MANEKTETAKKTTGATEAQLKASKAEAIARAAEELAWPLGTPKNKRVRFNGGGPTKAFKSAYEKYWHSFSSSGYEGVRKGCCCCHCARTVVRHALGNGFNKNLLPGNASSDASLKKYMEKFGFTRFKVSGSKGLSQLQRGDVLYYRKKSGGGHTWIYVGNKICAEGGLNSGRSLYLNKITDSKVKTSDKTVYYGFRNTGVVSSSPASSSTTSGGVDSGEGIDLHKTIAELYSAEAYNFNMPAATGEESESSKRTKAFTADIRNYLDNVQGLDIPTTSGAIPEYAVSDVSFESPKFQKNKPKLMAQKLGGDLLSYPNFVEAPTILLDFNGITIGGYGNRGDLYPNYINSMSVNKINGKINQYVFNLSYSMRPGEDPNFIDKLISRTGYLNPLKIIYGDSVNPSLLFREEHAVIVDVRRNVSVNGLNLNYTISAISSNKILSTTYKTFPKRVVKPSTLIYELLYDSGEISRELQNLFPGMRNKAKVMSNGLIPTNDKELSIGGVKDISPDEYLNYLVGCMSSSTNSNSTFYITYQSDNRNDFGGNYFRISEIISYNNVETTITDNNIISESLYEINVGYPGNNFITNFQVCNNDYWPLIYNYGSNITKYEYGIDADGNQIENRTNGLFMNNSFMNSSSMDANWWKQVTEFPISAKVTLKGLIKPAMLMTYIRVNTLFYGQKDLASGVYVVTAQEDILSGSGYTTTLTMLRVAGDNVEVQYNLDGVEV